VIRPATPADTPRLLELTAGTGFFKAHDVETLREVLDEYYAANQAFDHQAFVSERDGVVLGYCYYAPAPMTNGTWTLWWIAVDRSIQSRGVGRELLKHAEEDVRGRGGRIMLIETSSVPMYEPTRQFYLKLGYDQEAVIRDYYTDGDSLVMFRKRLDTPPTPTP
jgi:ribosomal protein S18 acetylase RimI-like enzyme